MAKQNQARVKSMTQMVVRNRDLPYPASTSPNMILALSTVRVSRSVRNWEGRLLPRQ